MNAEKKVKIFFSERRIKEKLVGQLFSRYAKEKKNFFLWRKRKTKMSAICSKKEIGFKFMKSVHKKTF